LSALYLRKAVQLLTLKGGGNATQLTTFVQVLYKTYCWWAARFLADRTTRCNVLFLQVGRNPNEVKAKFWWAATIDTVQDRATIRWGIGTLIINILHAVLSRHYYWLRYSYLLRVQL